MNKSEPGRAAASRACTLHAMVEMDGTFLFYCKAMHTLQMQLLRLFFKSFDGLLRNFCFRIRAQTLSLSLYQDIRINAFLRGTELTLFLNISKMHTKVQRIMRKYVDPNRYINN